VKPQRVNRDTRARGYNAAIADGCAIVERVIDHQGGRSVVNKEGEAVAGGTGQGEAAGVEQLQLEHVRSIAEGCSSLPANEQVREVPQFPRLRDGVGIDRIRADGVGHPGQSIPLEIRPGLIQVGERAAILRVENLVPGGPVGKAEGVPIAENVEVGAEGSIGGIIVTGNVDIGIAGAVDVIRGHQAYSGEDRPGGAGRERRERGEVNLVHEGHVRGCVRIGLGDVERRVD